MPSKALKKAIDEVRDSASQLPADPHRRVLAKLIGIVRRLADDNPEVEQPIAPEPPETTEPPVPPPTTKPV